VETEKTIPGAQEDDALFEALDKNKKKKQRRILIAAISAAAVLVIVTVAGIFLLQQRVQDAFSADQGEVLSAPVNVGTISSIVVGTGTLEEMDLEAITVPEGVQITEVKVKVNQIVAPGDVLAMVDMTSVMNTLADLQAQIEELDRLIRKAGNDTASTSLRAGVSGRVKAVYAKAGDHVADVMVSNGALALISMDGYMATSVRSSTLSVGDRVNVVLSDGKTLPGSVASVSGSYATVLVTDNGTECGDRVKVFRTDGKEVGPGTLDVHSPLRVTGYTGTVASAKISVNDTVSENTVLFTLKNTDYDAGYNALLRQREQLEQTMLQLLTIQRDGAVLATYNGGVYSIDHSPDAPNAALTLSSDDRMAVTVNVDESDILSLSMGQRATVTVPSAGDGYYSGLVMEVHRSADEAGNFSALVELDKARGMLPGMTANVIIRIQGEEGALKVPAEAVHRTRNGAYVYTSYDEEKREYGGRVNVVTGLENGTFVEILSGIGIGDTVYYTKKQAEADSFGSSQTSDTGSSGKWSGFGRPASRG